MTNQVQETLSWGIPLPCSILTFFSRPPDNCPFFYASRPYNGHAPDPPNDSGLIHMARIVTQSVEWEVQSVSFSADSGTVIPLTTTRLVNNPVSIIYCVCDDFGQREGPACHQDLPVRLWHESVHLLCEIIAQQQVIADAFRNDIAVYEGHRKIRWAFIPSGVKRLCSAGTDWRARARLCENYDTSLSVFSVNSCKVVT